MVCLVSVFEHSIFSLTINNNNVTSCEQYMGLMMREFLFCHINGWQLISYASLSHMNIIRNKIEIVETQFRQEQFVSQALWAFFRWSTITTSIPGNYFVFNYISGFEETRKNDRTLRATNRIRLCHIDVMNGWKYAPSCGAAARVSLLCVIKIAVVSDRISKKNSITFWGKRKRERVRISPS